MGLGIGNEVILVQNSVERRDLGTATTGVRFVETLGTSVAAAAFAAVFAAGAGHGLLSAGLPSAGLPSAGHVMGTLDVIFPSGAALLAVATGISLRLPRTTLPPAPAPDTPEFGTPEAETPELEPRPAPAR